MLLNEAVLVAEWMAEWQACSIPMREAIGTSQLAVCACPACCIIIVFNLLIYSQKRASRIGSGGCVLRHTQKSALAHLYANDCRHTLIQAHAMHSGVFNCTVFIHFVSKSLLFSGRRPIVGAGAHKFKQKISHIGGSSWSHRPVVSYIKR